MSDRRRFPGEIPMPPGGPMPPSAGYGGQTAPTAPRHMAMGSGGLPARDGSQPAYDGKEIRNQWFGTPSQIQWVTAGVFGVNGEAIAAQRIMRSPIFDVRPDLKSLLGIDSDAAIKINRQSAYGVGGRLFLHVYGLETITEAVNLSIYTRELAHLADPSIVEPISEWQDITADVIDGDAQTSIVCWTPGGNPLWYWGVEVRFDQQSAGPNPALSTYMAFL